MHSRIIQLAALAASAIALLVAPGVLGATHTKRVHKGALSRSASIPGPEPAQLARRQHHPARDGGQSQDTCVYVDAGILDHLQLLGIHLGTDLDLCLCLDDLPLLISANTELEALVPLLGLNNLISNLTLAINDSPNGQHCTYPQHGYAVCSKDNPCGFGCHAPYVPEGEQCVCSAPNLSCNGVCGSFPHGCGSSNARSWTRRSDGLNTNRLESSRGMMTYADAQRTCKKNERVCGVDGGSATRFECLDTATELESCGGCMVANPFFPAAAHNATAGRDCSAIDGAHDVACARGQCAVRSCKEGWAVSPRGDDCVRVDGSAESDTLLVQNGV